MDSASRIANTLESLGVTTGVAGCRAASKAGIGWDRLQPVKS